MDIIFKTAYFFPILSLAMFFCSPVTEDHKKLISDVMTHPENVLNILKDCPFEMSPHMRNLMRIKSAPAACFCSIREFNNKFAIKDWVVGDISGTNQKMLFIYVDNDSIKWPIEFQFRSNGRRFNVLNGIVLHDLVNGKCEDSMKAVLGIKDTDLGLFDTNRSDYNATLQQKKALEDRLFGNRGNAIK